MHPIQELASTVARLFSNWWTFPVFPCLRDVAGKIILFLCARVPESSCGLGHTRGNGLLGHRVCPSFLFWAMRMCFPARGADPHFRLGRGLMCCVGALLLLKLG